MDNNIGQRIGRNLQNRWVLFGFAFLLLTGMYVFFGVVHPIYYKQITLGLPAAMIVTIYVMMIGRVLQQRFQMSDGILVQLEALFLLGHFLPFMMDDVGNVHLFYADQTKNVMHYTFSALWNFILCGYVLSRGDGEIKKRERSVWALAVILAIAFNPAQSVILIALFLARFLLDFTHRALENIRGKKPWKCGQLLRSCFASNGKYLFWIPVWLVALAAAIWRNGFQEDTAGIIDALRTLKSTMLNMTPIFHSGILIINIAALFLAGYRFVRRKETDFFWMQMEMLLCMGITAVFLVLLCLTKGDRYLVQPEVMLAWMGWLLLMTVSSLAYILRTVPRAVYLLPILVYLVFCEVFLHYTAFADFQMNTILTSMRLLV